MNRRNTVARVARADVGAKVVAAADVPRHNRPPQSLVEAATGGVISPLKTVQRTPDPILL